MDFWTPPPPKSWFFLRKNNNFHKITISGNLQQKRQKWSQKGSQNRPKIIPKIDAKKIEKRAISGANRVDFGTHFQFPGLPKPPNSRPLR